MEGLTTAVAARSRCCQITIITPFPHTRTNHTREPPFFPTNPHRGTRTVWQRAKRGNKKLEKILNSRELFVDFLWMDCRTPRASPGPGPTWFGQSPGQTNAGPLSRMTSPISLMTKWRYSPPSEVPAAERRNARPPPALLLVPTAAQKFSDFGRTRSDAARASAGWSEA